MERERSSPSAQPTGLWSDSITSATIAFVAFATLAAQAFWGPDAYSFFQQAVQGIHQNSTHALYIPWTRAVVALGDHLGIAPMRALTTASAFTAAIFVFAAHRSAVTLGLRRTEAIAVAAAAGCTPGVVFFGTILEVQGFALAFIGLAWWAAARACRRTSSWSIAVLGSTTGAAGLAHATGHLLAAICAVFVLTWWRHAPDRPSLRAVANFAFVGAAAHGCSYTLLCILFGLEPSVVNELDFLTMDHAGEPRIFRDVVLNEYLLAFAPTGVVAAFAVRDPRSRLGWLATQPLVIGLLVFSWDLLTRYRIRGSEHGAYLLAFAFPLALWALRGTGVRIVLGCAAVGLATAVGQIPADTNIPSKAWDAAAVFPSDDPGVIVMDTDTAAGILVVAPRAAVLVLGMVLSTPMMQDEEVFDGYFDVLQADGGRQLVLECGFELVIPHLRQHLEQNYQLRDIEHGVFRGIVVERRRP